MGWWCYGGLWQGDCVMIHQGPSLGGWWKHARYHAIHQGHNLGEWWEKLIITPFTRAPTLVNGEKSRWNAIHQGPNLGGWWKHAHYYAIHQGRNLGEWWKKLTITPFTRVPTLVNGEKSRWNAIHQGPNLGGWWKHAHYHAIHQGHNLGEWLEKAHYYAIHQGPNPGEWWKISLECHSPGSQLWWMATTILSGWQMGTTIV